MKGPHTEQERFWAGSFGADYRDRVNANRPKRIASNIALFATVLQHVHVDGISDILELGCGDGQNLEALRALLPDVDLTGVEINEATARAIADADVICGSAMTFTMPEGLSPQLVFTKGLLIHLPALDRHTVYQRMYDASERYVLFCEYHSPTEVEIPYRGHAGKLWKADFAAEFMEECHYTRVVADGFVSRHSAFPLDDITWQLLEKV